MSVSFRWMGDDRFVVHRPILTPHAAHLPDQKLLTFCSSCGRRQQAEQPGLPHIITTSWFQAKSGRTSGGRFIQAKE
ncbi:MAG: hypothetical protein K6U78_18815 [Anaerolineae bacterium]|nr:hypothetical protein [Anaerolineae bacterium]